MLNGWLTNNINFIIIIQINRHEHIISSIIILICFDKCSIKELFTLSFLIYILN